MASLWQKRREDRSVNRETEDRGEREENGRTVKEWEQSVWGTQNVEVQTKQLKERQEKTKTWKQEMGQRSVCLWASAAQCSHTAQHNHMTAISAVEAHTQARQTLIEPAYTGGWWGTTRTVAKPTFRLRGLSVYIYAGCLVLVFVNLNYNDALNKTERWCCINVWMYSSHKECQTHVTE